MKTAIFSIIHKRIENINGANLAVLGSYGPVILPFNTSRLIFAKKRDLKGWFSQVISSVNALNRVYSVNLATLVSDINSLHQDELGFWLP